MAATLHRTEMAPNIEALVTTESVVLVVVGSIVVVVGAEVGFEVLEVVVAWAGKTTWNPEVASVVTIEVFETGVVDVTLAETISLGNIVAVFWPGVVVTVVKVGSAVNGFIWEKGVVLNVEGIVGVSGDVVSKVAISAQDKILWLQNANIFCYQNSLKLF